MLSHVELEIDEAVEARFEALDHTLARLWQELYATSRLIRAIERGEINKKLYALYLCETYHYTLHNSRNQALVGVRAIEHNDSYLKFCFEHASEEVGHEQMAVHDLLSLGLQGVSFRMPAPRPATEVLIAYLYWISATGNPVRRLGYSYWAEGAYQYINPLIERVQQTLGLKPNQLTFFIAHSRIDEDHARQVKKMISRYCKAEQDWRDVSQAMETSLRLTGGMMEGVYQEYERLLAGHESDYLFLNALP